MTVKAVPEKPLINHNGRAVEMEPGPCLWCNRWVTSERDEAGATDPHDPCWATEDGDFGCDLSPETSEDGCGDHARPYDLARHLLRKNRGMPGCGP